MTEKTARKFVLSIDIDVRWGDMDALAHVNNAAYFVYFEQARMAWLEKLGDDASGCGPILAATSATFLKPVEYPARITVQLYCGAAGRSSLTQYYDLVDRDNNDLIYAHGEAVVVWIDQQTGKSTPLPDSLRAMAANSKEIS